MSSPEWLVNQVLSAAMEKGLRFSGENALRRYDDWAYNKMFSYRANLDALTYLRLGPVLLEPDNLARFARFVRFMHDGQGGRRLNDHRMAARRGAAMLV
mmetsp:Transcript_103824/g.322824  ORF Transcript_103824/g.322824 Transcript_103824/m.322824 type:complete len:99 (-) Transcript_103824:432-728(-)